jgi:peptide/nickel transport system substrate-binding protein
VRKFTKSLGALGLVAALAVSVLAAPSQAATNNSITVAEVTAGGGGVQQIFSPWINSGSISHHAMFRALFKADANLTSVKPDLASGYKFSKDGKTLTVTLKSDIKWSDGKDLTVDDVVWSMNTLLRVAKSNAIYVNAFKQIVGSEAVNATNKTNMSGITAKGNVITISLKSPVNTFIPVLAQFMILPKHVLADEDILKLDTNNYWKNPVVAGPYKVGTFSQGNFITLVPNDKYEGVNPTIKEINIIVSSNLVADAKSGKLDYFTTNDPDTIRAMSSVSSFKSAPLEVLFYRYMVINPTGPFSNVKAREALKYGVDWNRLIPAIYGKAMGKVIFGGVTSGMPHYIPSTPKYKFDKAKATALLKEAKFDFSKTIRIRTYNQSSPPVMILLTAMAQQLEDLGMKVEFLPWTGDATSELWTNRNYELALKGLSAFNVGEWYAEYSNPATFEKLLGAQPAYAALNAKLLQATTLRDTGKILKDLQKLEQEDQYKLPLHLLKQVVFISKNISGTPTKWGNPLYVYQNNIASWSAN